MLNPKTAALPAPFGGIEGLDRPGQLLGGHALARVDDRNRNIGSGFQGGIQIRRLLRLCPQRKSTASRHGITGIEGEIQQSTFKLGRIAEQSVEIGLDVQLHG